VAYDLQALSDRMEIQDLLYRYCHAVDTKDWDRWKTCFTPDAEIDYTSSGGIAGRLPEVATWIAEVLELFSVTQHFLTNTLVTLAGDEATSRSYYYNPQTFAGDGPPRRLVTGGYYDDVLVRTPEGWRIARRVQGTAFTEWPPRRPRGPSDGPPTT
jgi:3-phenylpropionate/cinnamic acid dioxygenase small subunit